MALPVKYIHQVDETRVYCNVEELIESLAELAGLNVYEIKGFNDEHEGYIIEVPGLDDFSKAELAAEKAEEEIVSSLGSYLGDD